MISAVQAWLDRRLDETRIKMMRDHANKTFKHEFYINKVSTTNIILNKVAQAREDKGYPALDSMTQKNLSSNLFQDVYSVSNVQLACDKEFGRNRVYVQKGPGGRVEIHLASGLFAETKVTSTGNEQKLINAAMQDLFYQAVGYMRREIGKHRGVNERGYKTSHPGLTAHGVVNQPGAQTTIAGLSLSENYDTEMKSVMDDLTEQYGQEHQGTLDVFKAQVIDPIKTKYVIKDAQDFDTLTLDRGITIQAEYGDAAYNAKMKLYDAGQPLRNAIETFEDNFLATVGAKREDLEEFAELQGSRSWTQKTNAIVPKTIIDNLFPHKTKADMRLKVNKKLLADAKKDIGRKNTKGSVKSKSSQKRVSSKKGRRVGKVMGGKHVESKAGANPMALRALLNEMLPQAVAMNMTSPALNYRTGRFANSVRVDNITQGPRGGNTMIEASYMNNPYETFAPGGKMYTAQRDPERLIKKSIRQVASGIVGARFGIEIQ